LAAVQQFLFIVTNSRQRPLCHLQLALVLFSLFLLSLFFQDPSVSEPQPKFIRLWVLSSLRISSLVVAYALLPMIPFILLLLDVMFLLHAQWIFNQFVLLLLY
jgi:hypothetical protein